jgi:flagellar biosynthesis/type III secretory pathway protein FliH
MILRQATVSEQLRALPLPRHAAVAAIEMPVSPAALPEPTHSVALLEATSHSASAPRESRLTFEAVAAWLAVQDAETRTACASILYDELTHVHEAAKADGAAIGEAQGREQARQANQALFDALGRLTRGAEDAFAQELLKLGELCADIVAEAFAKVAGDMLPVRDAAVGAVLEVLKRVKEGRQLLVRVNPSDLPMLQQEQERLGAALPGRKFSLAADARIELGGCIVQSDLGTLDGRLEVQLRELYATLRAARAAQVEQP